MNDKKAAIAATTGPEGSWLQLFNPVSQLMGGNDRYPEWAANMFPGNRKAAWLTAKAGATALLAAALFGTVRGIQHVNRIGSLSEKDDPADKLKSQIGTTFETPLSPGAAPDDEEEKKKRQDKRAAVPKQTVDMPDVTDIPANTLNVALPAAAFLAAAVGGWNIVDNLANARRQRVLTDAVQRKGQAALKLMQARARLAKGNASDREINDALASAMAEENFVKTSSVTKEADENDKRPWWRRGFTGLGLLLAALTGAGAVGGYIYGKASDEDNLKYKALKGGLKAYARTKSFMTPVSIVPEDAEPYFAHIDAADDEDGNKRRKDLRNAPELPGGGAPISVTL